MRAAPASERAEITDRRISASRRAKEEEIREEPVGAQDPWMVWKESGPQEEEEEGCASIIGRESGARWEDTNAGSAVGR